MTLNVSITYKRRVSIFHERLLTLFILLVLYSHLILPLRTTSFYIIASLVPMFLWYIMVGILKPQFFFNMTLHMKVMLFFTIYTIIVPYLFNNEVIADRYLALSEIPFFYYAYRFNTQYLSRKINTTIVKLTMPIIVFTCIITAKGLVDSPYLSRAARSGDDGTNNVLLSGVGGYDFIYFVTICTVILFALILTISKEKLGIVRLGACILLLLLFLATVILSNYFTALNMILIGFVLFLVIKKITRKNFIMYLIILVSSYFVIAIEKNELLESIISISPSGKTLDRLIAIRNGASSSNSSNLTDGREATLSSSWEGFTENPFFGLVNKPFVKDSFFSGFGQHSQILDTLALFGIVGIAQIYFIIQPFLKRIKSRPDLRAFSFSILSVTLVLYLFNNTTPLIGYSFFFVYPVMFDWLQKDHPVSE